MPLVLALAKLSPDATRGLVDQGPVARAEYFKETVEGTGNKVIGYYLAEGGEWDVVVLVDFAEDQVGAPGVATMLPTQAASGIWMKTQQIRLYTPEEVQAALGAATTLRPPGSS